MTESGLLYSQILFFFIENIEIRASREGGGGGGGDGDDGGGGASEESSTPSSHAPRKKYTRKGPPHSDFT